LNTLIDEPRFLALLLICLWLGTLASTPLPPARPVFAPPQGAPGRAAAAAP
jgi:hypothetical protein